jgi:broad specificity phosphatase PhoE
MRQHTIQRKVTKILWHQWSSSSSFPILLVIHHLLLHHHLLLQLLLLQGSIVRPVSSFCYSSSFQSRDDHYYHRYNKKQVLMAAKSTLDFILTDMVDGDDDTTTTTTTTQTNNSMRIINEDGEDDITTSNTNNKSSRQSKKKVLLCIRHGVSVANELMDRPGNQWGDSTFRDDPTLIDAPLSTSGHRSTAQHLHHQLQTQDNIREFLLKLDLVVISPLTRCLQTYQVGVEPILSDLGLKDDVPVLALPLLRERVYTASDTGRDVHILQEEFPTVSFDECLKISNNADAADDNDNDDTSKTRQPWWYTGSDGDDNGVDTYIEWRPYGQGQWYAVRGEPQKVFDERMIQLDEWLWNRPEKNILMVAHWGVLRHMSGGTEWKNAEAKLLEWDFCPVRKQRSIVVGTAATSTTTTQQ